MICINKPEAMQDALDGQLCKCQANSSVLLTGEYCSYKSLSETCEGILLMDVQVQHIIPDVKCSYHYDLSM